MIADELKRVRKVGVPLVAITTADQPNTVKQIREGLNGKSPLLLWNIIRGFSPLNQLGEDARADLLSTGVDEMALTNFVESMVQAVKLPARSCILVQNGHRFLEEAPAVQALLNLRDLFKSTGRTIVLLGPDFRLPVELTQDFLVLEEALPTPEEIKAALNKLCTENDITADADTVDHAVDALRGLAAFSVEQAAALSLQPDKTVSIAELWERKRSMIAQVKGLSMERPGETFESVGGLQNVKDFASKLFSGPRRPRVVCYLDEIEKMFGGAGAGGVGDSSGTSQDQLGVILSQMEDQKWAGQIALGPPGSGKSQYARAVASTFGVPLLRVDLGAAKGSLVGQSEQQVRAIMRAILAIAGEGGAFFVATCNRLDALPPELRRRFRFGLWFFDLPDADERASISALHGARLNIGVRKFSDGWSGANIRDAYELAHAMQIDPLESAKFIVPAGTQDPDGLERLRKMAHGRFLSASYPGVYRTSKAAEATLAPAPGRKIAHRED